MNHAVVTEHLADYLEGDLALDLRALVDAHLDGCPECALEVRRDAADDPDAARTCRSPSRRR